MATENVVINDSFKITGGHDTPPKKDKKTDEIENKIPISEKDVEGLTYIQED